MPGVTKKQVEQAKEWDLLSYLQAYEPQELRKCGNEYCTVSHDSLKISNGKWHWHSRGVGGRTALDYLIKVRGMAFVEAVETLCGVSGGIRPETGKGTGRADPGIPQAERGRTFSLPEPDRYGTAMVSYLQERGIDAGIISRCIGLGILYEGRRYHNCVFLGRDPEGKARYACIRGIRNPYKGEVEGSDKRYGFCLPSRDGGGSVTVAESPIDALSIASLKKMRGPEWEADNYLSLGGTAPCALLRFLEDHPAIEKIKLCLDNDRAGLLGMERIRLAITGSPVLARRALEVEDSPPPASCGKDYNDLLRKKTAREPGRGGVSWQL